MQDAPKTVVHKVVHHTAKPAEEKEEPDLVTKVLAGAALDKVSNKDEELKDMAQKALTKINGEEATDQAAAAGAVAGIVIGGKNADPEI